MCESITSSYTDLSRANDDAYFDPSSNRHDEEDETPSVKRCKSNDGGAHARPDRKSDKPSPEKQSRTSQGSDDSGNSSSPDEQRGFRDEENFTTSGVTIRHHDLTEPVYL